MNKDIFEIASEKKNIVLLGEAGCGKSEIALNLAYLLKNSGQEVHLFDMDMTKPLFRSRDLAKQLEADGINMHFQEQFMDAPVVAGGVVHQLKQDGAHAILDVGGDYIGARSIGGYAPYINKENTTVYYVINPFRPWSLDAGWASQVLSEILGVSHIRAEAIKYIGNPNLGESTTLEELLEGVRRLKELVDEERVDFICAEERLASAIEKDLSLPLLSIKRYLAYPW